MSDYIEPTPGLRRAKAAGITTEVCNHTFRGTYLENGGTLEKARQMAAHASTRATQLFGRREDCVTLDEEDQYSGLSYFRLVTPVRERTPATGP